MLTDTQRPVAEEPDASAETAESGPSPAANTEAAAPAQSEGPADPTAAAADPSDPYSSIRDLDPDKLLDAHPGLKRYIDSKAGEIGDRLSKRQRAEVEREIREQVEAERHQQYLDSLVDQDDLVGLGEVAKRQRLAERERVRTGQASLQVARHTEATLGQAVVTAFGSLPKHLQAVLYNDDGQTFRRWAPGGSVADGIAELIRTAVDRGVEAGIAARYPSVKNGLEQALQLDRNGETLGGEPSPDTRPGAPGASRTVTDADIRRLSLKEYEALFDDKGRPRDGVVYRPQG